MSYMTRLVICLLLSTVPGTVGMLGQGHFQPARPFSPGGTRLLARARPGQPSRTLAHRPDVRASHRHTLAVLSGRQRVYRTVVTHGTFVGCTQTGRPGHTPWLCSIPIAGADVLAVDEHTGRVFVNCGACGRNGNGDIVVFDAQTGGLLRTSLVGVNAQAIVVDAATGRVFVANQGDHSVSVLDARNGNVVHTIHVAGDPDTLAVAERAEHVFVADASAANISVLDARDGRVVSSFRLQGGPFTMAVADAEGHVFVGAMFGHRVSMLDARSGRVIRTVSVGGSPTALVVDEHTKRVYISTGDVFDARTGSPLRPRVPFARPSTLAVNARTHRVFATTAFTIDVADTQSGAIVHSTNVATQPASVPVAIARTGRVVVLLTSPLSDSGQDTTGPGHVVVLDGHTGSIVRRFDAGDVRSFGLYNVVAVDNRANRVFVLDGHGLDMFDATRL